VRRLLWRLFKGFFADELEEEFWEGWRRGKAAEHEFRERHQL